MFDKLQTIIRKVESAGADFVEARYDELLLRTYIKDNGRFSNLKTVKRAGVGFNVFCKGATGYAFSADLDPNELKNSANNALGIAKASAPAVIIKSDIEPLQPTKNIHLKPKIREPAWLIDSSEKIDLINRTETAAKEYGESISSLVIAYGELSGEKMITNSEGTEIHWHPFIVDLRCRVTSKAENGDLVTAGDGKGGSFGFELFKQEDCRPEDLGKNAALDAKEKMNAKTAPAGVFRALCENTLAGVLAHESFGHLTEGDFIVSRESPLHNKLGSQLGSKFATIIDEGTITQNPSKNLTPYWIPYDDQGVKTKKTVLLDKGILKGYLHSRTTAKLLNAELSGNSRAIDYSFPPIPRMKNTYFTPGDLTEEEALEQLGTGIYAIKSSGGQVSAGDFLFKAVRGYWVENGQKKYPLKDVSLTGNILDLLKNIEGATRDLIIFSSYFGGCGKSGQSPLPVGLGGPKLVINNVRFGGESK